jgi:hypothetical protein
MKNDRANFDWRWEEMAPLVAPSRIGITTRTSAGEKQSMGVFDSTMMQAAEMMAMFIAGHIINPSQQWFGLEHSVPEANQEDEIREWNEECRDRFFKKLSASMFYAEGPESLIDYGGFGTGCLMTEEAPPPPNRTVRGFQGFRFCAHKIGRYVIAEGADGMVDTLMYEFEVSSRVAYGLWGEECPMAIRVGHLAEPDKPFKFVHSIYPRPSNEQDSYGGNKGMPWASCWVEYESKKVVKESGYRVFPAAVPRYQKTPGEIYGRGRGDIAFPDASTLNTAKMMGLEDWALKIRPPVMQAGDAVMGTLKLVPGGPTRINTHGRPIQEVIMPWQTGSHPDLSQIKEEELRRTIREIFFVDSIRQLMETHKSEMTALEFAKKMQLLFRIMGPVYGRMEWEFLYRTIDIGWDLMYHSRAFSPPPPVIEQFGGDINITFKNPIALAQKSGDAEALMLAVNDLAPMAQQFPQMWDPFDPDKIAAGIGEVRGVPAKWMRSQKEVVALRAERQKQDEAQLQMEQVGQGAEAAGKVAPLVKALSEKAGTAAGGMGR